MSETTKGKGMLCPVCSIVLVMAERQGVEIDYCPTCRGVWLDRGELDKIIERAASEERASAGASFTQAPQSVAQPEQSPWVSPPSYGDYRRDHHPKDHDHEARGYKRRSWLSDLFD
jgi:uncharacterized protein